jgi:hypothetical protein
MSILSFSGVYDIGMDVTTEIKALRLFLEKEDRLWEYSYAQTVVNEPSGLTISFDQDQGPSSVRRGPAGESIDAYILTLRYFMQNNESISIKNMSNHINSLLAKGLITEAQASRWEEVRNALNQFLDSPTFISLNGEQLTN